VSVPEAAEVVLATHPGPGGSTLAPWESRIYRLPS